MAQASPVIDEIRSHTQTPVRFSSLLLDEHAPAAGRKSVTFGVSVVLHAALAVAVVVGTSPAVVATAGESDLPDDAVFRIGSVTKAFTVTRLLQLADEGRLSLDDPIDQYVPDTQNGTATLRQLADMTSGVFNYTEDADIVVPLIEDLTQEWPPEKLIAAMRGLQWTTPFGPAMFRAIDHQSTMGAYVGRLAVRGGKGTMVDWRYADGAKFLPPEAEVRKRRPAEAGR